ncbi:MAG: S9 family peptidase [Ignavibacteria bacterium]|nr:S9 family peptidase [Ignavibacteria bacterium]
MKITEKVERYPVEKFFSVRTISGFTISPDNKKIFYITNTTGTPQIWRIPIEGGWTDQISTWKESVKMVSHFPKSAELIFQSDNNGNENLQIFRMPDNGGEVDHLTTGFEESQCYFSTFNKSGTHFLFSTNKRLKHNFDVYIQDLKTGKNQLIKKFDDPYPTLADNMSSDEKYVSFIKVYGNINSDILLLDRKNKSFINITEHDISVNVSNSSCAFDKNSKGIYYISDEGREFKGIKYYNISKKTSTWIIKEKWDVTGFKLSEDCAQLLWTINKNGSSTPKIMNIKTGKTGNLRLPKGHYTDIQFTYDNKKLVILSDSPLNPGDLFVYDIKLKKLKQITNSLVGGVSKKGLTKAKDVFYNSFDGLKIHALLYVPEGTKKNGKNPAIVWPHGGPEHQEMHIFSKYVQVMTNAGYIVIAPNFRGSTGYGKTFQKKIYKDWGGAEFNDVLGSVDYLKKSGYVDPKKLAVVGGSFGGFMCMTCVTKRPDIWKCAVDVFGPANLFTFINSVPQHWKKGVDELVGNVVKDKAMLKERSPIFFIKNIKCPLLVVQGKHDPRVVEAESVQIVKELKKRKKPHQYILLEDEGHGFSKVSNQILVFKNMISFLDKYLR